MYNDNKEDILENGLKQMRAICEGQKAQIEVLEVHRNDLQSEVDYLKAKVIEVTERAKTPCEKCSQLNQYSSEMEELS